MKNSIQFNSIQFNSIQFNSIQFNSIQNLLLSIKFAITTALLFYINLSILSSQASCQPSQCLPDNFRSCTDTVHIDLCIMIDESFLADYGGDTLMAREKAKSIFKNGLDAFKLKLNFITFIEIEFHNRYFPSFIAPDTWFSSDESVWADNVRTNFWNKPERSCIERDGIVFFTGRSGMGYTGVLDGVKICNSGSVPSNSKNSILFVRLNPDSVTVTQKTLAHEVGHLLGLNHTNDTPCANDCNKFPRPLMCAPAGDIVLTSCEINCLGQIFCDFYCNCLKDKSPDFPDDFTCPPANEPQFLVTTINPNPVLNCTADGDLVEITATLFNNNIPANRNIRAFINSDNGAKAVFVPGAGQCVTNVNDGTELWFVGNDNPNTLPCEDETIFAMDTGGIVTVQFTVRYLGPHPVQGRDFSVRVYSGTALPGNLYKDLQVEPFYEVTGGYFSDLISDTNAWQFNRPLIISETLIMDNTSPYDFKQNKKLIFKPGTGMRINSGSTVKMTNVSVEGCENMWLGISIPTDGIFEMSMMSSIKDAQYAVSINRGGTLVAKNCAFYNNNISIRTVPSGAGIYRITLLGNQYGTTSDGLKPAYSGQSPAPLEKGFAGVYLSDAGSVSINSDPVVKEPNLFFNLKYGVLSHNTNLSVQNSEFENITSVPQGTGYEGFFPPSISGKAIYSNNGYLIATKTPGQGVLGFNNCHTGIETNRTTAVVTSATMTNVVRGIVTTGGINTMQYNNIQATSLGIGAYYQSGLGAGSRIYYNTITLEGDPSGVGIATGGTIIGYGGTGPSVQTNGNIEANTITLVDGAAAIDIVTADKLSAVNNQVYFVNEKGKGLRLQGGKGNTLNCNTVINTASGGSIQDGIYAIHPERAAFVCNTSEGTNRGLHFEGMLIGGSTAKVARNTMKNNTTGLFLGADAIIGPQKHQGNRWQGQNTKAQHLTPGIALLSLFIVDASEDDEFIPSTVDPSTWFFDEPTIDTTNSVCAPAISCPLIVVEQDDSLERKIVLGALDGEIYQEQNNWLAQRRLYERIAEQGNPYPNDTAYTNFISQAQSSGLAAYAGLQNSIRDLFAVGAADRETLDGYESGIETGLAGLTGVEAQLYATNISPQDSADLSDQRDSLLEALNQVFADREVLANTFQSARDSVIISLLSQNAALAGSNNYQICEKTVNEIFLNTIAAGIFAFSEAEADTLRNIAMSCPLLNGEAVLRARAMLLMTEETPVEYDDEILCDISEQRTDHSQQLTHSSSLTVYPNPANEAIIFQYQFAGTEIKRLFIFNALGQTIQIIPLPDAKGMLSVPVKSLSEGLYWYYAPAKNGDSKQGKFIIRH